MFFYCTLFIIVSFLFFCALKSKGILQLCLESMAIFIPCFFAAVRDETIGIDMHVYGISNFEWAECHSLADTINVLSLGSEQQPLGYVILVWIDAALFHSLQIHLFILQLLTILPIYYVMKRLCHEYAWIGMFCYMTMLYPVSFNLMKQMLAVGICSLSLIPCLKHQYKKYFVIIAGSTLLLHATCIVCLLFLPIVHFMKEGENLQQLKRLITFTGLLAAAFLVIFTGKKLLPILATLKTSYAWSMQHQGNNGLSPFWMLYLGICLVQLLLYASTNNSNNKLDSAQYLLTEKNDSYIYTLFALTLTAFLCQQLSGIAGNWYRISYFFLVFWGALTANLYKKERSLLNKIILIFNLCIMLYAFYKLEFVNYGDGIKPYSSQILGI